MRADWEVTIIPGGPQWCELFLILYRTPYSTKLKVNRTDAVTVCLFRILTIEQVLLNPGNIAKHLIVSTVLEYCDIRNTNSSMPPTTGSGRYTEIVTGQCHQQLQRALYWNTDWSARCSCWLRWVVNFAKITTHEYSRSVKTTKCFATVTVFRRICSKVKILKRQTVTTSVLFPFNFVE